MVLNERKIKILEAIITDYIATAEPIGSRTIAKKYDLGISSATIRNEMSDLEDLGLIIQPHTSAGRIPSNRGYRLYVDNLMRFRELTKEETLFLQEIIVNNINRIDYLMQETAKALSILTHYTTVVSEPKVERAKLKHVQLIPLDETSIILVMVMNNKTVKNQVIHLNKSPDMELLNKISVLVSNKLKSLDFEEIDPMLINELIHAAGPKSANLIQAVVNIIRDIMFSEENIQVYLSGAKNILSYPEFSDLEKAKTLIEALEEKELLITLLGKDHSDSMQIVIGEENQLEQLKDCSIIKATYKVGNSSKGSIGVIGPTRMDYPQVISVLNGIVKNINSVINALSGG